MRWRPTDNLPLQAGKEVGVAVLPRSQTLKWNIDKNPALLPGFRFSEDGAVSSRSITLPVLNSTLQILCEAQPIHFSQSESRHIGEAYTTIGKLMKAPATITAMMI
jgi:hypothetical protein